MKLWITSKMTKISRIDLGSCNCYLLEKNGHYVLVDTGIATERNKVEHIFKVRKIKKIDAIFLTHVHTDQAGNAAYLSRKYHCKVYASKSELEGLITGECQVPGGRHLLSRCLNYIMHWMECYRKFTGVNNVAAFPEEQETEVVSIRGHKEWNLSILKTSGHTVGSVSILVDGEVALVGDAMSHGFVGSIYPTFAEQEEEILPSWKKLLQKRCHLYLPAHGRPVKRRLLLESYSVYQQNEQIKIKQNTKRA